jgi:hypothetical protein
LARIALKHLDLVGKGIERDRRPTQDEIDELIEYFETNPRQVISMGRIVSYAIATTMTRRLGSRRSLPPSQPQKCWIRSATPAQMPVSE